MRRFLANLLCVAVIGVFSGCTPRTFVRPNPGPKDRGIRYYRPKPYLMLKPLIADKQVQPDMVEISVEYLPDFSEEYSIHIRSGLGVNETSLTLEDGWNLTALSVKADSQTDENLKAVGDLAGNLAKLTGGDSGERSMGVRANNVPMGLYEAVITPDSCGVKRLYGFRYVGFFPFASCPIDSCGSEQQSCHTGQVYGLVWEDNQMVFRLVGELPEHVDPREARSDDDDKDLKTLPPDLELEEELPVVHFESR